MEISISTNNTQRWWHITDSMIYSLRSGIYFGCSIKSAPIQILSRKPHWLNIQLPMENISVFFPITLLSYTFQNLAMKTSALLLAVGVAAVLAMVIAPSLGGDASARKSVECSNGGGHEKECGSPPAKNTECTNPEDKEVNCGNLDDWASSAVITHPFFSFLSKYQIVPHTILFKYCRDV